MTSTKWGNLYNENLLPSACRRSCPGLFLLLVTSLPHPPAYKTSHLPITSSCLLGGGYLLHQSLNKANWLFKFTGLNFVSQQPQTHLLRIRINKSGVESRSTLKVPSTLHPHPCPYEAGQVVEKWSVGIKVLPPKIQPKKGGDFKAEEVYLFVFSFIEV